MKNKILVFQDMSFEFFAISKSIQKQSPDCEIYAVIDLTKKQLEFFNHQKIVNYKKIWYLYENIKNNNEQPDLEYLSNFEKKTKIELWKLIQNDRIFYNYNYFHKFSKNEILIIVEKILRFYEKIIDEINPNYLVTPITYNFNNRLLFELCTSKKIPVLMLIPSRLGSRFLISSNEHTIDDYEQLSQKIKNLKSHDELKSILDPPSSSDKISSKWRTGYQKSKILAFRAGLRYILNSNDHTKSNYTYFGRKKIKVLLFHLKMSLIKRIRYNFLKKNSTKKIEDEKFILFPLITEPEHSLLIEAPFYINVLDVIKNISKSIPMGYTLYVKEHPSMDLRDWRPISFYKQILSLPNTKLIDPDFNNSILLQKMSLIISYASTLVFQAAYEKKNAICISDAIFSELNSVQILNNWNELPNQIKNLIDLPFDESDFLKYLNILESVSFNADELLEFQLEFLNNFQYGGFLADIIIDELTLNILLEKYDDFFKRLGNEFIQKMNN